MNLHVLHNLCIYYFIVLLCADVRFLILYVIVLRFTFLTCLLFSHMIFLYLCLLMFDF